MANCCAMDAQFANGIVHFFNIAIRRIYELRPLQNSIFGKPVNL